MRRRRATARRCDRLALPGRRAPVSPFPAPAPREEQRCEDDRAEREEQRGEVAQHLLRREEQRLEVVHLFKTA